MTDTNAGGARPASDVDALIERLQGFNPPDRTIASQRDYSQAIHDAADALVQLREERDQMRAWLNNNMTHYNTAEAGARPILAEFGKRVWYHVTDDTESFPFSAALALAQLEQQK